MTAYDFSAQRLFIDTPLEPGIVYSCERGQANYLLNVLRLGDGGAIHVFNGRDGEWRADVKRSGRSACELNIVERIRPQTIAPDLHYLFAPLKRARLDYMVQKATEMGVSDLRPVETRRTNVSRVKLDRMRANAIEAAEQCGVLNIPAVREPKPLGAVLDRWNADRRLIFCDEAAPIASPLEALAGLEPGPLALLVGPEGGFDNQERERLLDCRFTVPISLGPRIMRADTAAVAALALVNASLGDWRGATHETTC